MSPWEELRYFDLPKETTTDVTPAGGAQIVPANPMRVMLLINLTGGGPAWVSTKSNVSPGGTSGIQLVTQDVTLQFDASHQPGVVQAAWFGVGTAAGTRVTIQEVTMLRWPPDQGDQFLARLKRLEDSINTLSRAINRLIAHEQGVL